MICLATSIMACPLFASPDVDPVAVERLLTQKCVNCHGPEKQEGGLRLDTRAAALTGGDSGPAIVPGDVEKSLFIQAVRHANEGLQMPPKEKLNGSQLEILEAWVREGAVWPKTVSDPIGPDKRLGNAWTDPANPVVKIFGGERLDLWSFQKPVSVTPPSVSDENWCRGVLDRFIFVKLKEAGLTPSPEADRRTLIRRLSFDLHGLPPSPEDIRRFQEDRSSDAYERLVEHLLSSPRYGERWGRHWLDVVRYADTNGYQRDEFRPTAYRYRDYVIRSFNSDKPYDEFIREQLAGDELVTGAPRSQSDVDRFIATGFLRAGPVDTTAPVFQEEARARDQLMADLVNTTSGAFLGLTMGCANCHDHKYDPLLQSDHFRMRAFFAAVKPQDEYPVNLADEQAEITRHNESIDQQATSLEKQIDQIDSSVRQVIIATRSAELPDEIRTLLAIPTSERDATVQEKLKPFEEKLKVNSDEVQKGLNEVQRQQRELLSRQLAEVRAQKKRFDTALVMTDVGPDAPSTHLFYQGDHTSPREEVWPGIPAIFDPNPMKIVSPRSGTTGRRLALANWIASGENPLTSRVMVNRLWHHHFGEPLVSTPNDFGYSGSRSTNPALLDWLANEFVNQGWSIKHMHRLMVLSSTYRQVSRIDPAQSPRDPENYRYWRQNIRRLDADAMRDAMLMVSGRLLPRGEGKPLWPPVPEDILRAQPAILEVLKGENGGRPQGWYADAEEATDVRSIFLIQKRSIPIPFLQVFDVPDPNTSCARRDVTTVAPQALNLLNSEFAVRMAKQFSQRLQREAGSETTAQIQLAFWIALGREATTLECQQLQRLSAEENGLAEICRAILNLNEFVYID